VEFNMSCETLKHLRHLSRPGDYFVSVDLADSYYTLGMTEEDRDFFTVNHRDIVCAVIKSLHNNLGKVAS
jgi:hypothetical protein